MVHFLVLYNVLQALYFTALTKFKLLQVVIASWHLFCKKTNKQFLKQVVQYLGKGNYHIELNNQDGGQSSPHI